MSLNLLHSLIKEGKLSLAMDTISKANSVSFNKEGQFQRQILLARLLLQAGKFQAMKDVLAELKKHLSLTDYSLEFETLTLNGILNFELNHIEKGIKDWIRTTELIEFYKKDRPSEVILRLNLFLNGYYLEKNGNYKDAKWKYLESMDGDKFLEVNLVYYHLGLVHRYMGDLDASKTHFVDAIRTSLDPSNLELTANLHNSLGEASLLQGDFNGATEFLNLAIANWEKIESKHGLSWGVYDLYCLDFIEGNKSGALENLQRLFQLVHDKAHSIPLSDLLLQLVITSLSVENLKQANEYSQTLQNLDPLNEFEIVTVRKELALKSITTLTERISTKFTNFPFLKNFTSKFIREELISLGLYLDLLIVELNLTKESFAKTKITSDIVSTYQKVIDHLIHPESLTIFSISRRLEKLISGSPPKIDLNQFSTKGKLEKEILTPSRMTILLHLIGRKDVSFSELSLETESSSGTISSVVRRLSELNLITISKKNIENRFVTVYNLTPNGLMKLENYFNYLKSKILDP